MDEFEKVSDDLRNLLAQGGTKRPSWERYDRLAAGETLFIPLNGVPYSKLQTRVRSSMNTRGFRLITRVYTKDGVKGIVCWAEPKVPA